MVGWLFQGKIFDVEQLVHASEDSDLHWVHPGNQS